MIYFTEADGKFSKSFYYLETLCLGKTASQNYCYLVPSTFESTELRFKKSLESLQKNSSSDTEYSVQPYRVIKQSSNETNTSLTGSFNIDQSGAGHGLSVDSNDVYSCCTAQNPEHKTKAESMEVSPQTSKLLKKRAYPHSPCLHFIEFFFFNCRCRGSFGVGRSA